MHIWKLEPTAAESEDWRTSIYKGPVIVRAKDETSARLLADRAFGIAVCIKPGNDTPLRAWSQDNLVTCRHLDDSAYEKEGPEEVLSPKE
jgi:hypothetical protein